MKSITWDNPNKMRFESAFKTFNQQTNVITPGNCIANTQFSNYIRPWNKVDNYGYIGKPGQFLEFDLQYFHEVPLNIRRILFDRERHESYCLYEFFIHRKGHREIIGHVLTDYAGAYITHHVNYYYGQSYWKREDALQECMKYICA